MQSITTEEGKGAADDVVPSTSAPPRMGRRGLLGSLGERFALVLAWIALVMLFAIIAGEAFFSTRNLTTMLGAQTTLVFLAMALLIPLTAGDFDMSGASVLTLSCVVIGVLNVQQGVPIGLAIAIALGAGLIVGVVNGFFVVVIGVDPFIATLGTGTFIVGIVYWISKSTTIGGVSPWLSDWVIVRRLFGVPLEFYYGLVLTLVVWYVFSYTTLGRRILFVGRGRDVARLSGIRVGHMRWGSLIACSVIAALAGVVYTGTTGAADPVSGQTFQLPAFAACFLGATCIVPGRYNPWGAFIAVYFLATGITGLSIMGVETWVQSVFYGGALVVGVSASQLVKRQQEKRTTLAALR